MREVTTADGRTLTVREGGDPGGVPILVHGGTPSSSLMYGPHVRDAEAKGIRLISYDRPGYGDSTRNEGRTVADCAVDVAAVCDDLDIERFCVWGVSGGGPHALATAALLPERGVAAAALASLAPFDADGLDFRNGMGELNVESVNAVLAGDQEHLAVLERDRKDLLDSVPEQLVDVLMTLLGPADREVLTGQVAEFVIASARAGVESSLYGWFDDDKAFVRPWGFELGVIRVPVLHWHGKQDRFVPFNHGVWLSEHIPGVESRLTPEDGHITLSERRVPEVHEWLLERFAA